MQSEPCAQRLTWWMPTPKLNEDVDRLIDLELQVRVGIATGLVVVGDVFAAGVHDKDAVVGQAANLAARLQELASPNTVIVWAETRRLAAGRFNYRDLDYRDIQGLYQADFGISGSWRATGDPLGGAERSPGSVRWPGAGNPGVAGVLEARSVR